MVDSVHQNIISLGGTLNKSQQTQGLTGFIYRGIRASTRISYRAINFALSTFTPLLPDVLLASQRKHWVPVLNGVLGDYLAASDNPLALDMTLVYQDQEISLQQAAILWSVPGVKPLLLIHGLCMDTNGWHQKNHNYGHELEANSDIVSICLNYNSGLAIAENGKNLANLFRELHQLLPDKSINVLAYSMGGLIIRSAFHAAAQNNEVWPKSIEKLVFLGTPHHGALLEKTGHLLDYVMSVNAFSAPFVQLTRSRSQGIKDLRTGRISDQSNSAKIPSHITTYAIAATFKNKDKAVHHKILGDGLVTVNSALGRHKKRPQHVGVLKNRQYVFTNVSHLGLLSNDNVYNLLQSILS